MTVAELIVKLQACDQSARVGCGDHMTEARRLLEDLARRLEDRARCSLDADRAFMLNTIAEEIRVVILPEQSEPGQS